MKELLTKLASKKLSTYAAIIMIFTYTILLNRDFECTCKKQPIQCNLYMGLPFFIILLLILLTDGSFQTVCRYLCSCAKCCMIQKKFWGSFFLHILKAAIVGLLWVAFVYLDGDWYVCCKNDDTEQQRPLACKAKDNITEKERVIIAELKSKSRVYGGSILFGVVLVVSFMPLFLLWIKCCRIRCKCCNRGLLLEELILEEEDNVLKEILRKSAKDQLTEKVKGRIRGGQSEECFDVAVELLDVSPKPTISEEQQEQNTVTVENPPPGNSPSLENQSPRNSLSLEPLVQQEENNQHEEQEDSDDSISEESTDV